MLTRNKIIFLALLLITFMEYNSIPLFESELFFWAILAHLLATILITTSANIYLTPLYQKINYHFYLLIFIFSLLLPIFGGLISIFIIFIFAKTKLNSMQPHEILQTITRIDNITAYKENIGEGGVVSRLFNPNINIMQRIKVLEMFK